MFTVVKYLSVIGAVIVLIIILVIGFVVWLNSSNPDYVWKKLNDEQMKSSFVFNKNGDTVISINPDERLALASTVKIMVALEYSFQIENGNVKPDEQVKLSDLEAYYVENLDGGAHEAWINSIKENNMISNEAVPIREVAKGMMAFSSNANTEYLMDKLGIEQIENRMKELDIYEHDPLYFFTASLFIPYELKNEHYPNESMKEVKDDIVSLMREMDKQEWIQLSTDIHEKLKNEPTYKTDAKIKDWWNTDFDQLFSDKFIRSSASEYANLIHKINHKMLPEEAQFEMEYVMGSLMENEANQQWLNRAGKKGGSTAYILTDAIFAEDKEGDYYEAVIFFNDLKGLEAYKLMKSLNEFELKLLKDEQFQDKLTNQQ